MKTFYKLQMKKVKKILLYFFVFFLISFFLCLYFLPVNTINFTLGNLSKIEFILLAKISPLFKQKIDPIGPQINLGSHRGLVEASSVENSPQSIEAAIRAGFKCLEVDISFSSDFQPYVYHGPSLELANVEGMFSDFTAAQITKFQLQNRQPIISLGTFCKRYANKFNLIYLDIKGDNTNYEIKGKNLWCTLRNYKLERIVLIGAPWRIIRSVKKKLPRIKVGYEQKGAIANFILGADTVSLYHKYEFSHAEYKLAKFLGLDVVIWTINDVELLEQYSKEYRLNILTDLNVKKNSCEI
jgi:glycerophosphoryl diester phosphodiesterase